jgi:hypothetical protein
MKWASKHLEAVRAKHSDAGLLGFHASVKADTSNGNRDIEVIANTSDIDLDREVVVPGGAVMDYFDKNKAIFLDHRYESEYVVGKMRTVSKILQDGKMVGWKIRVRMAPNELASDIIKMVNAGQAPGASVGFEPLERGAPTDDEAKAYAKGGEAPESVVRRWHWLETSLTWMPCNVACQATGSPEQDDSKMAALDGLVTKGVIRRTTAAALGLQVKPKRAIVLL